MSPLDHEIRDYAVLENIKVIRIYNGEKKHGFIHEVEVANILNRSSSSYTYLIKADHYRIILKAGIVSLRDCQLCLHKKKRRLSQAWIYQSLCLES